MTVYVVLFGVYHGENFGIIGIYKVLSEANAKMDEYNDSSVPDYYAIVEEHSIIG
jgi:hypothetical protein